jgi:Na+/H+ antiporter NhaC
MAVLALAAPAPAQAQELEVPSLALTGIPFDVVVVGARSGPEALLVRAGGETFAAELGDDGLLTAAGVVVHSRGRTEIELVSAGGVIASAEVRVLPGWISILPPLIAIAVALITKNVIPALFLGIWFGSFTINGFTIVGAFLGLLDAFEVYVLGALADPGHASIILFSFMIGGMVGIISKSGGMQGVVNHIVPLAKSPRHAQAATGLLGLIIFFDDYANVLVVGNTMRQVTDRMRISREKLAYIVDSTAAPVSCVALITTWIGYEVGLIGTAVDQIPGFNEAGYAVFLESIPYSFYPILCMMFVFIVAFSGRDFGPMYHAEVRARSTGEVLAPDARIDAAAGGHGELEPEDDKPARAINAALPVIVLIGGVLVGLWATGEGNGLREIIGTSDAPKALMWASLMAALTAGTLAIVQRILTLTEVVDAWYAGLKAMMIAMIILVLAWSLSSITAELNTAGYLVSVLGDTLPPGIVPALVFIISAATAFATGSSWGTMGILIPLVVPLSWAVLAANNMADGAHHNVIYSTVACVLGGAVWGDHCSPISDTTILSSMASGSDHIDHVRTQLPYALLVGGVGVFFGTLPTGFGSPWWLSMIIGVATLFTAHRYLSKPVDEASA